MTSKEQDSKSLITVFDLDPLHCTKWKLYYVDIVYTVLIFTITDINRPATKKLALLKIQDIFECYEKK